MKRGRIAVMCLVLFLTISSCDNLNLETNPQPNVEGNSSGNIMNRGLIAKQGDWIYYSSTGDASGTVKGLYKVKTDGTLREKLTSGNISYINVIGEWIFYVKTTGSSTKKYDLYKIKVDGSNEIRLAENCRDVYVRENHIYYVLAIDVMGYKKRGIEDIPYKDYIDTLYTIKIDGSGKRRIASGVIKYIVADEWIYYSTKKGFNRVKLDGSGDMLLYSGSVNIFVADDEYLYFHERVDNVDSCRLSNTLFKLGIECGEIYELGPIDISFLDINVTKDYLIYSDQFHLTRINKDFSKPIVLVEDAVLYFYVFDNGVYYFTPDRREIHFTDFFGEERN